MLSGRIFVTGGAGFLARGLYRRSQREHWPCTWTAFSRDDGKHVALQRQYPEVRCIRGDVAGDRDYLKAAIAGHDTVIHAAAVKYVDRAEFAVADTLRVNVHGSENVAYAALHAGIATVVGISTDKACRPVNLYGATKMAMERLFAEANDWGDTRFQLVRYGNVVGSTGSVIPMFKRQLEETGKVRVTNPAMTRFWMSVDEAIDVILLAVNHAQRGAVVVPSVRAMSMANLVSAVGAMRDQIEVIGERPGEKRHENLVHFEESVRVKRCWLEPNQHFELLPVGSPQVTEEPFTIVSNQPHEWVEPDEMRAMIADAEGV
jgi:UDP-N-acetylglucosamine 4,6-dehydratase